MAFKHLLETSNSQKLLQLMHGSNALPVYRRAQQAGIDLDKKQAASQVVINTQALLPAPVKEGNQVNWLLAVLATTTLIALFYFLGRRTNTFGGKSV